MDVQQITKIAASTTLPSIVLIGPDPGALPQCGAAEHFHLKGAQSKLTKCHVKGTHLQSRLWGVWLTRCSEPEPCHHLHVAPMERVGASMDVLRKLNLWASLTSRV